MDIFTLNPDASPKAIVILPSKVCNKGNSVWLLNKIIQPALLSIMDVSFGGIVEPIKSKLSKKEVIGELAVLYNYCTTYGVNTIVVGHSELFKYLTGGAKFTLSFGDAIEGVSLKVDKTDYLDFTGFKIIPFLNPVILNIYPNKSTEVVRGLSVVSSVLSGTYTSGTDFEMDICETITDPARATEVLTQLWSAPQLTSDIETTGLDWYRHTILTISFSPRLEEAYCFALADKYYDDPKVATKMRDLVGRFFTKFKGELIGHNFTGFDVPFLLHMHRSRDYDTPIEHTLNGINLTDTMLMAYVLKNSTERASIGLKELVFKHMGEYDKDVDQKNLVSAPLELVARYNNYDCRATWLAYHELKDKIDEEGFTSAYQELNYIAYDLVKMKMVGLRVDMPKVKAFREELKVLTKNDWVALQENEYVLEAVEAIAVDAMRKYNATHKSKKRDWTEFKTEFNPASAKQKKILFFDLLDLPIIKRSRTTKEPSADADTVEEWLNNPKIPEKRKEVIKLVSEYMTAQKVKNTYVEVMAEKAVEVAKDDFRMFTNFNQTATITGRLSSSGDINLQTIPNSSKYGKKVKELFIAPEGFILATADYNALNS